MVSFRIALAVVCCLVACRAPEPQRPDVVPSRAFAAREVPAHPAWGYVVRKGDTLLAIAQQYDVSIEEITRLNRIEDPDLIEVGQRLRIPLAPRPRDPSRTGVPPARLDRYRQELELAQRQLAHADFGGAEARVESLRPKLRLTEPGARELLIRLEEISAHIHAAHGEQEQAAAAFERALRINPGYEPPGMSPPKLLRAFQQAEGRSGTDLADR